MSLRTEVDFGLDRLRPGEAICRPQRAAEIGGSASAFIAGNAGMVANNRRREAAATGRKLLDELNPPAEIDMDLRREESEWPPLRSCSTATAKSTAKPECLLSSAAPAS